MATKNIIRVLNQHYICWYFRWHWNSLSYASRQIISIFILRPSQLTIKVFRNNIFVFTEERDLVYYAATTTTTTQSINEIIFIFFYFGQNQYILRLCINIREIKTKSLNKNWYRKTWHQCVMVGIYYLWVVLGYVCLDCVARLTYDIPKI